MAKQRASLKGRGHEIQGLVKRTTATEPAPPLADAPSPPAPPPTTASRSAAPGLQSDALTAAIEASLASEADASDAPDAALPVEMPGLRSTPAMPSREALPPAALTPAGRDAPPPPADDQIEVPDFEVPLDDIEVPSDDVLPSVLVTPTLPPPVISPPAAPISPPPEAAPPAISPPVAAAPPAAPIVPLTEAPPVAPPPAAPSTSPVQPSPQPPSKDNLMDDLLAAAPGVSTTPVTSSPPVVDDRLTEDILAAMPPTAGTSPVNGADGSITTVRSPLPPFSGAPGTPSAVGLAPVVTNGETPAPQSPGGPAPARLRVGGLVLEGPLSGEVIPPGPGVQNGEDKPLTIRDLTPEQARLILGRVTPEQLRSLSREIDRLYDRAAQDLANDAVRGEKALELLHQSRVILIEKPENYVDAEYQVQRVQALLMSAANSRQWATELGPRIFRYETFWMFSLLLAFILSNGFWPRISLWLTTVVGVPPTSLIISQAMPFLSTLFWGGLGGTIGALWSLWYHVSERRDFDREYNIWYLTQPIMGMVLGGLVYLLFATGLLVLQAGAQNSSESLGARLLPSLIAAVGGFRQNFVYEQMGRIVELFSGRQRQDEQANDTAGSV